MCRCSSVSYYVPVALCYRIAFRRRACELSLCKKSIAERFTTKVDVVQCAYFEGLLACLATGVQGGAGRGTRSITKRSRRRAAVARGLRLQSGPADDVPGQHLPRP
ncbi:hypothetical protein FGB62_28g233 [Gracilaria domingensis]|nr:hypothetical protein FGB62_28g233 [Gracilaria domingensis]